MIRISSHPRTFTPRPAGRVFVEDCLVIRAEPWLTRAVRPSVADVMLGLSPQVSLLATGTGSYEGRRADIVVTLLPSAQRLGGRRWWWQCPACGRRCGVLLTPSLDCPFWCRLCWGAVYRSDYRRRSRCRNLAWLLLGSGLDEEQRRLMHLLARRRRGVRRGRRVQQRAAQLDRKVSRWRYRFLSAWASPESRAALARVQAIEDDLRQQGLLHVRFGRRTRSNRGGVAPRQED